MDKNESVTCDNCFAEVDENDLFLCVVCDQEICDNCAYGEICGGCLDEQENEILNEDDDILDVEDEEEE